MLRINVTLSRHGGTGVCQGQYISRVGGRGGTHPEVHLPPVVHVVVAPRIELTDFEPDSPELWVASKHC